MSSRGQAWRDRVVKGTFSDILVAGEENRTAPLPVLTSAGIKATNPLVLEL